MYKIAYATGSRADYGIVTRYLEKLNNDKEIQLDILVTGSHLDDKYGKSINQIKEDGFNIAFTANINLENNDNKNVTDSMAIALEKFGGFFSANNYDLIIILGDRYEMLSVAVAAAMNRLPILHLHGGEVTYGNYDEFIRHSITKMSTYHFTSTLKYRNRVIQLGESPDRVFYMGALGAENCLTINEDKVKEAIKNMNEKKYFLVAFHPETLTGASGSNQVDEILEALKIFVSEFDIVLMGSNADTGSQVIRERFMRFSQGQERVTYIENINVDSYLYMMKNAMAIIGNSSSGIIEAPSLLTYTVNIGDRQAGREKANSIIDVKCNRNEIIKAIQWVLEHERDGNNFNNPYYRKNAAEEYYQKTKQILKNPHFGMKEFFDVEFML